MSKVRVAVLRGGQSSEYDISLITGREVLSNLSPDKYLAYDVLIDKQGDWFMNGLPVKPDYVARHADVAFNAMHGEYGEDGQVQHILDIHNLPYTGSKRAASAVAMNKILTKDIFRESGIKTPHALVIEKGVDLWAMPDTVFKKIGLPWVVKPAIGGSSIGASIVKKAEDLPAALEKAFLICDRVLVEEFIRGKEATCGVLENFRGRDVYSLLPVEIIPPKESDFFDYQCKYDGSTKEICPGNFGKSEKEQLMKLAERIHRAIGLRHYSRSDFIVSPYGIYALEVNTLPGLTPESLFPKSIRAVGSTYSELLEHLIDLALKK